MLTEIGTCAFSIVSVVRRLLPLIVVSIRLKIIQNSVGVSFLFGVLVVVRYICLQLRRSNTQSLGSQHFGDNLMLLIVAK